jgi:hypothetical protein
MQRICFLFLLVVVFSCNGTKTSQEAGNAISGDAVTIEYSASRGDSLFFDKVMENITIPPDPGVPFIHRMIEIGTEFLNTPYVASTLEAEGEEHLVVNLLEVDCTTFVEYVTALAICSHRGETGFKDFITELMTLRYRDGIIDGYPSRLHYFTDWLKDNERKGYLTIVSDSIGNKPMDTDVNFMTSNPQYYRQLQDNPAFAEVMAAIESKVSDYEMRYISKDVIDNKASLINDGDIIAFVTNIEGLDVSHTGLAIHKEGRLHLLHASSVSGEVEITPVPLSEYLQDSQRIPGILVARVQ